MGTASRPGEVMTISFQGGGDSAPSPSYVNIRNLIIEFHGKKTLNYLIMQLFFLKYHINLDDFGYNH